MTQDELVAKYGLILDMPVPFDVKVGYVWSRESAEILVSDQRDQLIKLWNETHLTLHQWNSARLARVKPREPQNQKAETKPRPAASRPDLKVEIREVKEKLRLASENLDITNSVAMENVAVLGRQLQSLQKRAGHL
jgi:hypothetical protein